MASDLAFTIHYEETDDGWVAAQLAWVPAATSFGRTRGELTRVGPRVLGAESSTLACGSTKSLAGTLLELAT